MALRVAIEGISDERLAVDRLVQTHGERSAVPEAGVTWC